MLLISKKYALAQRIPEDYGYRHLIYSYQNDKVDLIVISKKGEEKIAKPLFFFCQGSLPRPVIIYDEKGLFGTLPFSETPFLEQFHIVVVAKPNVPIISKAKLLDDNFCYMKDSISKLPPKGYSDRNYLDYYVFRNNFIIKQLFKERWIKSTDLVVAGHSEGSTIAAKMASKNKKITKLIYSGGNPYGRISTVHYQNKIQDNDTIQFGESTLNYWKKVVENPNNVNSDGGDTFKATYSFSQPQKDNLMALNIPILITYGSKDIAGIFIDLLQIDCIRERKNNIKFKSYHGLEHNFFYTDSKSVTHFENENWNKVAQNWLEFLNGR